MTRAGNGEEASRNPSYNDIRVVAEAKDVSSIVERVRRRLVLCSFSSYSSLSMIEEKRSCELLGFRFFWCRVGWHARSFCLLKATLAKSIYIAGLMRQILNLCLRTVPCKTAHLSGNTCWLDVYNVSNTAQKGGSLFYALITCIIMICK